jgi:catechol 2,3-dioxygenase-like lactoylglutathione lyase family enzyme
MVNAINHVTLAVQDLDRSFSFYTGHLGLRPVARWYKGAYLVAGSDWICLSLDPTARNAPLPEYRAVSAASYRGRGKGEGGSDLYDIASGDRRQVIRKISQVLKKFQIMAILETTEELWKTKCRYSRGM